MNRLSHSIILLLLLTATVKPAQSQRILPAPVKKLTSHKPVYLKDREMVYAVKLYGKKAEFVKHDTLIFKCNLKDRHPEVGQTECIWRRKADTMKEFTGVTENDTTVWIHPPRFEDYRVLAFSPFPVLKYPLKAGSTWNFDITIGGDWGSKDLMEWKGLKEFKAFYKLLGKETLSTKLGKLECYKILAEGSNDFGKTQLVLFFNEKYGFVQLHYQNINQTSMQIELIDEVFLNPLLQVGKK
ncbi:hypothetical protein GXP67_28815 [Rhodocytophaga rosea]|uniref:DUF3108 domain-containing protein n=1 Tax=Rhodocytophaga rosea TaxID=2704465 RepID=A0A6C0GRY8_9BACT|nr:hypothetical protein [Rhodocytophaga rosea]QHT70373.1 hypothetical protein GXP67_28815 [Rhodocytophaga rosea]